MAIALMLMLPYQAGAQFESTHKGWWDRDDDDDDDDDDGERQHCGRCGNRHRGPCGDPENPVPIPAWPLVVSAGGFAFFKLKQGIRNE